MCGRIEPGLPLCIGHTFAVGFDELVISERRAAADVRTGQGLSMRGRRDKVEA